MKKKLILGIFALIALTGSLCAQSVQIQDPVAEKTKMAVTRVTIELGVTEAQRVRAMRVFNYYYTRRALTSPAPLQEDVNFRDNKLKDIFTEQQMIVFKEKMEASLN